MSPYESLAVQPQKGDANSETAVEFSVVMPCLNEAETLASCIAKARNSLSELNCGAEVIVAENGSVCDFYKSLCH